MKRSSEISAEKWAWARIDWARVVEWVAGSLVAAIAAWHVQHFLQSDGLRFDEARVAMNLVERDYAGLVRPLDYQQAAPIGFLWIEKTLLLLFGRSEYALRVVPLLAALAAPVLVWRLGHRIGGRAVGAVAAALLSLHPVLELYACELKQYSLDAALALLLLNLVQPLAMAEPVSRGRWGWLAVGGTAAVLLSHPVALVVIGLTPIVLWAACRRGGLANLRPAIFTVTNWALAVLVVYWISLAGVGEEKWARDFWRDALAPWPPWENGPWCRRAFNDWLFTPWIEPKLFWVVRRSFLAGALYLGWKSPRALALLLIVPLAALVASWAGQYPLNDRLLLFIIPCGSTIVAVGLVAVVRMLGRRVHAAVGLLAVAAYVDAWRPALDFSLTKLAEGHDNKIELRPLLETLTPGTRAEEIVLATNIEFPARFYAPDYRLDAGRFVALDVDAPAGGAALAAALTRTEPGRVRWLLTVDHVWPDWHDPRSAIEGTLRAAGRRFTRRDATGCSIYRIE